MDIIEKIHQYSALVRNMLPVMTKRIAATPHNNPFVLVILAEFLPKKLLIWKALAQPDK